MTQFIYFIDRKSTRLNSSHGYNEIFENDFQKFGKGKDGKAKPLVGMGLFMDGNGLPIAMNIYPGNENETRHLIPLQKKMENVF